MFPYEYSKTVSCLSVPREMKLPYLHQYQSYISKWYIIHQCKSLHKYLSMDTQKYDFFLKEVWNWILTCTEELKSPYHRYYQSYISNWYINGKVSTSTTAWKPKNFLFSSEMVEIEFWLVLKCWNHSSFVNISLTVVANWWINGKVFTSILAWKPKNLIFFSKKVKIESCLVFWLMPKCWNCPNFELAVLTTCTFILRQVCTIGPSFFNTTYGMHHRPIKGRHLVFIVATP